MLDFYRGKSVFITGHTGFKGAWFCRILQLAGAKVTGYALAPESGAAYEQIVDEENITSVVSDIRDLARLQTAFDNAKSEIVFHLAAQPIVLEAYSRPAYTFETNVMGTVNLLECMRRSKSVRSVVVITTDKVYRNNEWCWPYRENDTLGSADPYSTSKACAELVVESYITSFLKKENIAVSTIRAGNVIGGGDIAPNRIIPDCVRAGKIGEPIIVRNPHSVRPYQHVLEPLFAYLMLAERQYENISLASNYNIGPSDTGCKTTGELADIFCEAWGDGLTWINRALPNTPHESNVLKLDCAKMRSVFGWQPLWSVDIAVKKTVEWEKADDKQTEADRQIGEYANG